MTQTYTTLSAGLTTVFTAPASCSSSWTYEAESFNSVSGGLLIQNVLTNFDTNCWPAGFTGNGRANGRAPSPIQLYSPGICPSGYTTAGGFTPSGTTSEICCLQNFVYSTEYTYRNSDSAFLDGCISTYSLAYGSTIVEGRVSPDGLATTTVTGPLTMWAQPLWIEYQETDLSLFPATTTSSTSRPTSSTPQPSITMVLPSSSTATSSATPNIIPSNRLSHGAIAGIGVGVALVALVFLATALFFCLRRWRSSKSRRSPTNYNSYSAWQRHELDALGSAWQSNELDASEPRRELEGSRAEHTRKGIARKPVMREMVELE